MLFFKRGIEMTNEEIFTAKANLNKCLDNLTALQKELILDMLSEARHEGFNEGWQCALDFSFG